MKGTYDPQPPLHGDGGDGGGGQTAGQAVAEVKGDKVKSKAKMKQRQKNVSFCQRLAAGLDMETEKRKQQTRTRASESEQSAPAPASQRMETTPIPTEIVSLPAAEPSVPDIETPKRKEATPPFAAPFPILELPTEIRQEVLCATVDDDALLNTDLKAEEARLSAVCRDFNDEMLFVFKRWTIRRAELKTIHENTFKPYIKDLMATAHIDLDRLTGPVSQRQRRAGTQGKGYKARDLRMDKREDAKAAFQHVACGKHEGPSGERGEPFAALMKWRSDTLNRIRKDNRIGTGAYRVPRRHGRGLTMVNTITADKISFDENGEAIPEQKKIPQVAQPRALGEDSMWNEVTGTKAVESMFKEMAETKAERKKMKEMKARRIE